MSDSLPLACVRTFSLAARPFLARRAPKHFHGPVDPRMSSLEGEIGFLDIAAKFARVPPTPCGPIPDSVDAEKYGLAQKAFCAAADGKVQESGDCTALNACTLGHQALDLKKLNPSAHIGKGSQVAAEDNDPCDTEVKARASANSNLVHFPPGYFHNSPSRSRPLAGRTLLNQKPQSVGREEDHALDDRKDDVLTKESQSHELQPQFLWEMERRRSNRFPPPLSIRPHQPDHHRDLHEPCNAEKDEGVGEFPAQGVGGAQELGHCLPLFPYVPLGPTKAGPQSRNSPEGNQVKESIDAKEEHPKNSSLCGPLTEVQGTWSCRVSPPKRQSRGRKKTQVGNRVQRGPSARPPTARRHPSILSRIRATLTVSGLTAALLILGTACTTLRGNRRLGAGVAIGGAAGASGGAVLSPNDESRVLNALVFGLSSALVGGAVALLTEPREKAPEPATTFREREQGLSPGARQFQLQAPMSDPASLPEFLRQRLQPMVIEEARERGTLTEDGSLHEPHKVYRIVRPAELQPEPQGGKP